jgi:hypothetical protein
VHAGGAAAGVSPSESVAIITAPSTTIGRTIRISSLLFRPFGGLRQSPPTVSARNQPFNAQAGVGHLAD